MILPAFAGLFLILWGILSLILPGLWQGLQWLAKTLADFAARHSKRRYIGGWVGRFGSYTPVVLILIAGALVTLWAGDQFLDLAELVHNKSPLLQTIDSRAHEIAVAEREPLTTSFFVAMTIIGGPSGLAVILVAVAIGLAVKKRWRWLAYLAVSAGGGALLNLALKQYFARARPLAAEMLRKAHGYSFPSGHAMGATVAFGALAYLTFRASTSWIGRAAALALAITLVLSIALSRVYLGAHWLSDIGAGIAAGLLWHTTTTVAYETFRQIRRRRAV